jgi:hypothetical protein
MQASWNMRRGKAVPIVHPVLRDCGRRRADSIFPSPAIGEPRLDPNRIGTDFAPPAFAAADPLTENGCNFKTECTIDLDLPDTTRPRAVCKIGPAYCRLLNSLWNCDNMDARATENAS